MRFAASFVRYCRFAMTIAGKPCQFQEGFRDIRNEDEMGQPKRNSRALKAESPKRKTPVASFFPPGNWRSGCQIFACALCVAIRISRVMRHLPAVRHFRVQPRHRLSFRKAKRVLSGKNRVTSSRADVYPLRVEAEHEHI